MELTLEILGIIAITAFLLMVGFFIVLMRSASKLLNETSKNIDNLAKSIIVSVDKMDRDISDLKIELVETMGVMNTAVGKVTETISSIHNEFDRVSNITHAFEGLASQVYNIIAPPINKTAILISALTKGTKIFKNILIKKNN